MTACSADPPQAPRTAPGTALVTGGARRLGRAIALELARRGHDVAVHFATSEGEAREAVAEIEAMGRRAAPLQADLLAPGAAEALPGRAAEALGGPVAMLVHSASPFERDTLGSAAPQDWDRHMGAILRAPFALLQAMGRQGIEARPDGAGEPRAGGSAVLLCDAYAFGPMPGFFTYALAKEALWALARRAARDLAPAIRVNAIAPGPVLRAARQSEAHFRGQRRATPLGRGATPEEVCAALGFLLAAPSVTGELIRLDGGHHLALAGGDGPG